VRAQPFEVGRALASAWTLTRAAGPTAIGVSLMMVLTSRAVGILMDSSLAGENTRLRSFVAIAHSLMMGTYLHGVLIAQMAGAAMGDPISVPTAIGRSARAYGRMFWAKLASLGAILLGSLACGVPGLIVAVAFWLVLPAAYLQTDRPATQVSADLTRGRRWTVLVLLLLSRAVAVGAGVVPLVATRWLAESMLEPGMETALEVVSAGLDLVRELGESFTMAIMLGAYLSLRYAADRELEPLEAAPAAAPLFRSA
jgi:hypothetical protein